MHKHIISAAKITLIAMILAAFFVGGNSCYDGGDLCNSSQPDILLLKDRKISIRDSNIVWLYESRDGADTIILSLNKTDTSFNTYWHNDYEDQCGYGYGNCIVYCEEILCEYSGSKKLKFEKLLSVRSCPLRFSVIMANYQKSFELDEPYRENEVYNFQDEKYIVSRDSGLVYLKLKTAGISIKRIK